MFTSGINDIKTTTWHCFINKCFQLRKYTKFVYKERLRREICKMKFTYTISYCKSTKYIVPLVKIAYTIFKCRNHILTSTFNCDNWIQFFFDIVFEVLQSKSLDKTTWILKCSNMVEWNVVKHIRENNAQKNHTFLSAG